MPTVMSFPLELLIPILAQLPLASLFALSSTCRALRNYLTDPSLLDSVLKEAIIWGSLKWICPVRSIPRSESNSARPALLEWVSQSRKNAEMTSHDNNNLDKLSLRDAEEDGSDGEHEEAEEQSDEDECEDYDDEEDTGGEDPVAILTCPDFPRLSFVCACWDSDSMMNRKRLWGQVQRFEKLWKDYRTNGWRDPLFYPADEIDDSDIE